MPMQLPPLGVCKLPSRACGCMCHRSPLLCPCTCFRRGRMGKGADCRDPDCRFHMHVKHCSGTCELGWAGFLA